MNNFVSVVGLCWVFGWIALLVGWVMNIIEIVHTFAGPITGMLIARLVGVIAFPLGGVLGYF